jgi:hypothetical protein
MEYRIEPIGAQFSTKALAQLSAHFTANAQSGWRLHSVFEAQQPGCLGIGSPSITYFAIYVRG